MIGSLLVTDSSDKAERLLSPFKYFDVTYIIQNGRYETFYLVISAAIVLASIAVSYIVYNNRDIHAGKLKSGIEEVIMNIFIRELKANRKALIIWSVCMALLVLSGMGKFTAYAAGGSSSAVFDKLPNTLKIMLGFNGFEVTKISGFFAFLFPYIELTTAIHAALLGSSIIAKEERDKTTEFLIAKPISRNAIITSKLLVALVNVIVINLVSLFSSFAIVSTFDTGEDITGCNYNLTPDYVHRSVDFLIAGSIIGFQFTKV